MISLRQVLRKTTQILKSSRSAIGRTALASLCLAIALTVPAAAVENILVGSSESHSIEKFSISGGWRQTFASTGPWIAFGIAVSPKTNDVFVATNTSAGSNIILRYTSAGAPFGPKGTFWSSFDLFPILGTNPVQSVLFDPEGNLYVASYYGVAGNTVEVLKFPPLQLLNKHPKPTTTATVTTTLGRGDQIAFDRLGNLCVASILVPNDVQCFNSSTGALVWDYASEFAGFNATIQPVGLAFGPNNNLYVSSVFAGQIVFEQTEHSGPMVSLTAGLVHDIGYITVDSAGTLYVPSYHNPEGRYEGSTPCNFYACMDYDTSSDVVYKINPSTGAVTDFITTHLWGPYQMIFVPF